MSESLKKTGFVPDVPNDDLKWQDMAPPDHGNRDWFGAGVPKLSEESPKVERRETSKSKLSADKIDSMLDEMDKELESNVDFFVRQNPNPYQKYAKASNEAYERAGQEVKRAEDAMDVFIYGGKKPESVAQTNYDYSTASPAKKKILSKLFSRQ